MSEEKIKIAIADDETLFRKGIAGLLEGDSGLQVVFEAENGKKMLEILAQNENNLPDVILMDLKMPELNGVETTKAINKIYPEIKIIALSSYYSKSFILNMIEAGVSAYLAKNSTQKQVIEAIYEVKKQGFFYDATVMKLINENLIHSKTTNKSVFDNLYLTRKEREILVLICAQYTTQEIADKLFISPRTVDGHRNNLLQKTNCKNSAGLVVFAIQNGIVDIDDLNPA